LRIRDRFLTKAREATEITWHPISERVLLNLSSIVLISIAVLFALAPDLADGKSPAATASIQSNVPQIRVTYDNKIYDMSPFVVASNGQIITINVPQDDPTDDNPAVHLQMGRTVNFQFDKQPSVVHVFTVDYEGDLPSFHALRKIKSNEFQIAAPVGVLNLEVHAFYPDGRYTSQDMLANVTDGASSNAVKFNTEQAAADNTFNPSKDDQPCTNSIRLQPLEVSSNTKNTTNSLAGILHDNNIGTGWIDKGADLESFIKSTVKHVDDQTSRSPWLQIDLGEEKIICNIAISFGKQDKSINFFKMQTSADGAHFKDVGAAESSPVQAGAWLFTFPDLPDQARYVRISNLGNLPSEDIKIAEFVLGGNNISNTK
jgi:F5/8 type C domain